MSQIALPLDISTSSKDAGYLVTESNVQVHTQLENWDHWPHGTAILVGPPLSGKTSMAGQFLRNSDGLILDDADRQDAEEIFHLWNRALEQKQPLLLTASRPVAKWHIALPDLRSRLAASLMLTIDPPDEAMIEGLLQQYFATRSLSISEETVTFLSKRMERSYENIQLLAQAMNMLALERKKPVTIAVAKAALEGLEGRDDESSKPEEFDF